MYSTEGRISILRLVASQAAISLEHARLYADAKLREDEMQKLVSSDREQHRLHRLFALSFTYCVHKRGGRRLVGLEPDEDVSAYQMSDLRPPEDHRHFMDEILPKLSRDGHWEGERTMRHFKTKADIPVHQTIFFITDKETNQRIAMATICRDITGPKQNRRTNCAPRSRRRKRCSRRSTIGSRTICS